MMNYRRLLAFYTVCLHNICFAENTSLHPHTFNLTAVNTDSSSISAEF